MDDSQQLALEIDDEDIYGDDGTLSFEKSFHLNHHIIICITMHHSLELRDSKDTSVEFHFLKISSASILQ